MKIERVYPRYPDRMAKRFKNKKAAGSGVSAKVAETDLIAPGMPPWFNRDWLWGLILLLAVVLVYQPVWYAGFIWDDDVHVTANPCIIGPLGLKEIWTTGAAAIGPLTITTFWAEHVLWGLDPLPYHFVNVLLHALSAVVLWQVLRGLQVPGAMLGATLWAFHPVAVESVAWISETKNTESGLFFLVSIFFYLRWLRPLGQTGSGWNYGLAVVFAALAMASKSSTVILPLVLGLCAWWIEGRWQWRHLVTLLPFLLLAVMAGVVTVWTQGLEVGSTPDPEWLQRGSERLVTAGTVPWFYLTKLLWPYPLIAIYPRWKVDATQWFSYLPLLAVVGALLWFWVKRKSWSRSCLFAWSYFLVALLPVSGFSMMSFSAYSFVADHFQYLASMGPLALAGAGMSFAADRLFPGKFLLRAMLFAGLVLGLGVWSWQRAWVYQNEETLWTDTLASNPNCWLGHNNLGNALLQKGQVDDAIAQFQYALEENPNYALAQYNLGNALLQKGQVDDAIAFYKRALELNPGYASAHSNLGSALLQKGQADEAIAQYQLALEIDPNRALDYNNLGFVLCNRGRVDEAIAQYQKALGIDPKLIQVRHNLVRALLKKGDIDQTIIQLQEVVRLNPSDSNAQNNLAAVQAMARQSASQK